MYFQKSRCLGWATRFVEFRVFVRIIQVCACSVNRIETVAKKGHGNLCGYNIIHTSCLEIGKKSNTMMCVCKMCKHCYTLR